MTEPPTAIEQALAAALADFDRDAEIVLERWRKHLVAHPITEVNMPAITWESTPEAFVKWLREYVLRTDEEQPAFETALGYCSAGPVTLERHRGYDMVHVAGDVLEPRPVAEGEVLHRTSNVTLARFKIVTNPNGTVKIAPEPDEPRAAAYFATLVSEIRSFAVKTAATAEQPKRRGPTPKTQERARVFRRIKDQHPSFSLHQVANQANHEEKVENFTEEVVRNAYRAMGWEWERADRIR